MKIFKDERGQALTEFAITIPVVMLFFLLSLQYMLIVNATNLCHYSAFASARSYAVNGYNPRENHADFKAQISASVGLMPLSYPAPGELSGLAFDYVQNTLLGVFETLFSSAISSVTGNAAQYIPTSGNSLFDELAGSLFNEIVSQAAQPLVDSLADSLSGSAAGFISEALGPVDDAVANNASNPIVKLITAYFRLGFLPGQSFEVFDGWSGEGEPGKLQQFTVALEYKQPLALPGLIQVFDFVGGSKINTEYQSYARYPYFPVLAKCTMGKEPWSGEYANAPQGDPPAAPAPEPPPTQQQRDCYNRVQAELERIRIKIEATDRQIGQSTQRLAQCQQNPPSVPANVDPCANERATLAALRRTRVIYQNDLVRADRDLDNCR